MLVTEFASHIVKIVFITSFKMVSHIYDCSSTFGTESPFQHVDTFDMSPHNLHLFEHFLTSSKLTRNICCLVAILQMFSEYIFLQKSFRNTNRAFYQLSSMHLHVRSQILFTPTCFTTNLTFSHYNISTMAQSLKIIKQFIISCFSISLNFGFISSTFSSFSSSL